jgi:hypothetical protein
VIEHHPGALSTSPIFLVFRKSTVSYNPIYYRTTDSTIETLLEMAIAEAFGCPAEFLHFMYLMLH